jgi:two-component system, chemotaxis family, chemotaxis protein CheY
MTHDGIGNILVVEDNTDAREAMTAFLEGEGYHAVGAANGQEALGHLRTSRVFCVILLDLGTPVIDGWEFWAKRVRHPAMASVPVVIMSLEGLLARRDGAMAVRSPGPVEWRHLLESVQHHC